MGLPYISHQLKHIVNSVQRYSSLGEVASVTLGYGNIGTSLIKDNRIAKQILHEAEIEAVKAVMDPDGTYLGSKGEEHKAKLVKVFAGYQASGYNKEQVFSAMAEQGIGIVNVGMGFCYGGRSEDFDESLPCIGSLRCNPVRCSNAVVTPANIPKWKDIYYSNVAALQNSADNENLSQIREIVKEAKSVLSQLGVVVDE